MHQDETPNIQHATLHHTTYSGRPTREAHQDKVKMLLFDAGRARLRRCANASDCTAMHCVEPPTAEEPLRSKRTPDELWLYARGTLYVVCQVCIKDTRIPKNSRCVFAAKAPENWPARSSSPLHAKAACAHSWQSLRRPTDRPHRRSLSTGRRSNERSIGLLGRAGGGRAGLALHARHKCQTWR